jgi:hypothetical protein
MELAQPPGTAIKEGLRNENYLLSSPIFHESLIKARFRLTTVEACDEITSSFNGLLYESSRNGDEFRASIFRIVGRSSKSSSAIRP